METGASNGRTIAGGIRGVQRFERVKVRVWGLCGLGSHGCNLVAIPTIPIQIKGKRGMERKYKMQSMLGAR